MPTIEVNSGPHKKLLFIGHADAAAYDTQAGKVGACVEEADRSDVYRSLLPEAHDKFAPILVAKSNVARGVNAESTAKAKARAKDPSKVEDVPEQYTTYANRVKVLLESGAQHAAVEGKPTEEEIAAGKALWAEIDAEVHTLAATMACDSSPSARQKGPDKGSLAKADEILARSETAMETTVTKLLDAVPGFDLVRDAEGKPERMSLARLVQEFVSTSV